MKNKIIAIAGGLIVTAEVVTGMVLVKKSKDDEKKFKKEAEQLLKDIDSKINELQDLHDELEQFNKEEEF